MQIRNATSSFSHRIENIPSDSPKPSSFQLQMINLLFVVMSSWVAVGWAGSLPHQVFYYDTKAVA